MNDAEHWLQSADMRAKLAQPDELQLWQGNFVNGCSVAAKQRRENEVWQLGEVAPTNTVAVLGGENCTRG